MVVLTGQCHCGGVRARFETERAPETIQVRACQCGFCRRHGAATASDAGGRVHIESKRPLQRYRFGARTTDMLLCTGCGVYVAAALETDSGFVATLNVAGLAMAPLNAAAPTPVDYDGEDAEGRRARRMAGWTPAMISEGPP